MLTPKTVVSAALILTAALGCLADPASATTPSGTRSGVPVPSPSPTKKPFTGSLTPVPGKPTEASIKADDQPIKLFTPQDNTYSGTIPLGRIEAAYTYRATYETSTFSWRFNADKSYCTTATLIGPLTADVYNNGGKVPGTHYSKPDVSPCYGFHSTATTGKINDRGNYQLIGNFKIQTPTGAKLGNFIFFFQITR